MPAERALLSGRVTPRPSDSRTMPHRSSTHTSSSAIPRTHSQRITCSLSIGVLCLERCDHSAQERGIGHCFAAGGKGLRHCRENTGDEGSLHCRFLSHDVEDFIGDAVQAETALVLFSGHRSQNEYHGSHRDPNPYTDYNRFNALPRTHAKSFWAYPPSLNAEQIDHW